MSMLSTSSREGLLGVRFCVAPVLELGVKSIENELEYAVNLIAFIKLSRNKTYTPMICYLNFGNHAVHERNSKKPTIIKGIGFFVI